jgi:preprotein translocase subunit SecY
MSTQNSIVNRVLFFCLFLFVYRFAVHVVVPGVDSSSGVSSSGGAFLVFFDLFSGGALAKMSVLSLGLVPYISASIVVQILSMPFGFPSLAKLKKEVGGAAKITKYTRLLSVAFAFFQAFIVVFVLNSFSSNMISPSFLLKLAVVFSLVFGALFAMWLGERLSSLKFGNGVSILIFFGIISGFPSAVAFFVDLISNSSFGFSHFVFLLIVISLFVLVVFVETSQRRLMVSRSVAGGRSDGLGGGATSIIPLKLNVSGVIPAIFASSLMLLPTLLSSSLSTLGVSWLMEVFLPGSFVYSVLFGIFVIFFSFFYSSVVINPRDVSDTLRRSSTFIPGIRPGVQTEKYLKGVISRLTLFGAVYVAFVCVLPMVFSSVFSFPYPVGGTSVLIVVVVAIEMLVQFQLSFYPAKYRKLVESSGLSGRGSRDVL